MPTSAAGKEEVRSAEPNGGIRRLLSPSRRGVGALHQLPPAAKGIYVVHPLRGFGTADGHTIATGEHMAQLSCSSSQHRSRKRIAHNDIFAHWRPPITAAAAHPSPPTPRRASAAPPSPAGTECWRLHERRRRRQRLCGVNALLNDIHGQDTHTGSAQPVWAPRAAATQSGSRGLHIRKCRPHLPEPASTRAPTSPRDRHSPSLIPSDMFCGRRGNHPSTNARRISTDIRMCAAFSAVGQG